MSQLRQEGVRLRPLPAGGRVYPHAGGCRCLVLRVHGLLLLRAELHERPAAAGRQPGLRGPGQQLLDAGHHSHDVDPGGNSQNPRLRGRVPGTVQRAGLRQHVDRHVRDRPAHARRHSRPRVHQHGGGHRPQARVSELPGQVIQNRRLVPVDPDAFDRGPAVAAESPGHFRNSSPTSTVRRTAWQSQS